MNQTRAIPACVTLSLLALAACGGGGSSGTGSGSPVPPVTAGWVWMSGAEGLPPQPADNAGQYGTLGEFGSANSPGGRIEAVTWIDSEGNLWLFGGWGIDGQSSSATNTGELNDLWEYSRTVGQWRWVGGSKVANDYGTYGTLGVASVSNVPSARQGSVAWTDSAGNLWLFGGEGWSSGPLCGSGGCTTGYSIGLLNDLWKYTPSTGQWVWVGGTNTFNSAGVYGTQGVPAASNIPAARHEAVAWTDRVGNFWLYGGSGANIESNDDLWKYDSTTNLWTWVAGTGQMAVVFGSQGVAAPENTPGLRRGTVGWTDASGNLWLFGGWGQVTGVLDSALLGDLWKFSPASGLWVWVGGPNTAVAAAVYGTQGVAAPGNQPAGRGSAVGFTDINGKFWLFGGIGAPPGDTEHGLSDLWQYDPTSGEWTWVSGSNQLDVVGSYGSQGTGSSSNQPGARQQAVGWADGNGNLWLFGGQPVLGVSGLLNDLWRFQP